MEELNRLLAHRLGPRCQVGIVPIQCMQNNTVVPTEDPEAAVCLLNGLCSAYENNEAGVEYLSDEQAESAREYAATSTAETTGGSC